MGFRFFSGGGGGGGGEEGRGGGEGRGGWEAFITFSEQVDSEPVGLGSEDALIVVGARGLGLRPWGFGFRAFGLWFRV